MKDFLEVLERLGFSGLLIGAVAWLARKIVGQGLSRDIETFKAGLTKELEAFKAQLSVAGFRQQTRFERLQALQQEAIFELSGVLWEAVKTTEWFLSSDHCLGFEERERPLFLIGEDWGNAYRKLNEKGLLFSPALEEKMRAVVNGIEKVKIELRPGFPKRAPHPDSGRWHYEAWDKARVVFDTDVLPHWQAVRKEFQNTLGVETTPPGQEAGAA